MLRQVLSENGFTTTCVMSPTDMEPVLARGNVDLMVLDVMLPGEDGFSICRRLRATSGIPIIMLTALGEDVNRIVGLRSEEHTSELQSLMRISSAVFCLKTKKQQLPLQPT